MITGDSHKAVIPPSHQDVKAGFVVYSPDSKTRNIIILDKGELAAIDRSSTLKKTIFTMQPGDLVGVAALLEREPFRYNIEATKDSKIILVNEDCMESELKTLPIWLLAVIKSLSATTRKLKEDCRLTRVKNTLKSLAEFLSHLNVNQSYRFSLLAQEFNWQTKIQERTFFEDLKALARRKLVNIKKENQDVLVIVTQPQLLQIYVDYLDSKDKNSAWLPFSLNLTQKKILVTLSTIRDDAQMDAPSWLKFFSHCKFEISVGEWIKMLSLGWFIAIDEKTFQINKAKIDYYLLALRYEANIRGVL